MPKIKVLLAVTRIRGIYQFDVVYGVRIRRKEGFFKPFAYKVFYRLCRFLAQIEMPLDSGDSALVDRNVVDLLNSMPEKSRFIWGLRTWTEFRQTGLVYKRDARAAGDSKYNFQKLIKFAFDGIFNFSNIPLPMMVHRTNLSNQSAECNDR